MNIVMWMLAGGILGWIAFSALGFNEARGKWLSIIIGAFGGAIGGRQLAPVFITPVADEFSMTAMMFALAVAGTFLAISHVASAHFDL